MKFFLTNLLLFVAFAIAFSSLAGCGGGANVSNNANAAQTAKTETKPAADPSTYPLLASGVADADMELPDGTTAKLSQRKGDVLLVNLWGIWCGPCRAEMPHLVQLQEQYKDRGLKIIGLNVGDEDGNPEDFEKIRVFGEKMKLNYELVRAPRTMTDQIYRVANFNAVPLSLLIDREGRLRGVLRGAGPSAINQLKQTVARAMDDEPGKVDETVPAQPGVPDSVKAPSTGPDKLSADEKKPK